MIESPLSYYAQELAPRITVFPAIIQFGDMRYGATYVRKRVVSEAKSTPTAPRPIIQYVWGGCVCVCVCGGGGRHILEALRVNPAKKRGRGKSDLKSKR